MSEFRQMPAMQNQEGSVDARMRQAEQAIQLKSQRREMDRRVQVLANRVMESRARYGLEHPSTRMLTRSLETVLRMKELTADMQAISMALSCVTDTIGLLDDTMQFDQNMLVQLSSDGKYGFFYNLKVKRQAKRAVKAQEQRMRAFTRQIQVKMDIANGMMDAMQRLDLNFDKKKKGAAPTTSLVDDYLANFGGGNGASAGAPAAPAAPESDITGGL